MKIKDFLGKVKEKWGNKVYKRFQTITRADRMGWGGGDRLSSGDDKHG